jgi:hypothetical protein
VDALLDGLARRMSGDSARPHVRAAWAAGSEAIGAFPYSDHVARSPGPLQKGVSHPLWLDPSVASAGHWRAWQNDLAWTEPWGPVIAERSLRRVRDGFRVGAAHLAAAVDAADPPFVDAVAADWRIVRTIEASLTTILNLLAWIPVRDSFSAGVDGDERRRLARRLRAIARAERANAAAVLPLLEQDSRLGFASDGGGVVRGGLFTPELVRWKLGQIDDLLLRALPEALGRQPASPGSPPG